MTASSLLNFQSNYQIRLNLIIFQTLDWDLYIIRTICWLSKQPVFLNNLLKKISWLLNSLHTFLTHWVIKILLPLLKFYPAKILLLFQPCFHCCTNFNFHHLTTSCINGLDFVSMVFRQQVNCSIDLISAYFVECLTFLEAK